MKRLYTERQQSLERRRLEETWRAYRAEKRMMKPPRVETTKKIDSISRQIKAPWED